MATVTGAAVNVVERVSFHIMVCLGISPSMRLLDHAATLF